MGRELEKTTRADKIRRLLVAGHTIGDIVDRLAPDDPRRQHTIKQQIYRIMGQDEEVQTALGLMGKGQLVLHTPDMVNALVRRASKGNIPAIKLALEASGFHNPRLLHEHSGEININIKGLPRPERHADVTEADVVEDADVVDTTVD
jgi:hypothetical protein